MNSKLNNIIVIYAIVMLAGGLGGYKAAHSVPSLISGIVSAIVLLAAWRMTVTGKASQGFQLAGAMGGILTLVFVERLIRTAASHSAAGRNLCLALMSGVLAVLFLRCSKTQS